ALNTPPALPQKERLTFKPGAYLENGDPIRSLFLPKNLRQKFLDIAADNTRRGLEMCGMLCGTPINNALFVRCLLIPDQKCTSDTCETENEEVMFDYCMKEDLLLLGWIHTHPTQTCFMSSRDLHTHAGYQVMMPESVAIVCAPKFQPS
ncbi:STAM-binding protein, partial [Fusarium sp. NRRL 25303]